MSEGQGKGADVEALLSRMRDKVTDAGVQTKICKILIAHVDREQERCTTDEMMKITTALMQAMNVYPEEQDLHVHAINCINKILEASARRAELRAFQVCLERREASTASSSSSRTTSHLMRMTVLNAFSQSRPFRWSSPCSKRLP